MKLLKEVTEQVLAEILTEEASGKKNYYITGVFMQGNIPNRNGRSYPTATLVKEANRYKDEYITTKRSLGELNHPESIAVNPKEASHIITDLWVEGDNIMGKAKILDTPNGRIVKALMDEGVSLGVSSRGFGSLKEVNGVKEVQEDFHLATVDIVQDPSAPHAFVNGIMEDREFIIEGGYVKEIAPRIEPKKLDEKALLDKFEKLLKL